MKTILVTGGGGFIGSNLVASLLKLGTHNVVVCDAFGTDDKWRNLSKHPVQEIIAPEDLFSWLDTNHSKLEIIYHLASISSTLEENVDLLLKHNFSLSVKIWRWCNAHQVRLIYGSAAATYGAGDKGFDDNAELAYLQSLRPLSPYGWSKNLFDSHVATAVARGEVTIPQWVGFKIFNAYGANEYHKGDQKSVLNKIATQAIGHGSIKLFHSQNPDYKDGEQKRDVVYIKDVIKILLWCLGKPKVSGLFNLGSGKASSYNEMAKAIFNAVGRVEKIQYIDMPEDLVKNYQYFTEAKMDKLRQVGYDNPFFSLEDGVKDYVQNYLLKDDIYL